MRGCQLGFEGIAFWHCDFGGIIWRDEGMDGGSVSWLCGDCLTVWVGGLGWRIEALLGSLGGMRGKWLGVMAFQGFLAGTVGGMRG